ncbi:MAG: hypothetical protein ACRDG6_09750 [Candidatus Limnocylindria bacterium]
MRLGLIALGVLALVIIGSSDAFESTRQLGDLSERSRPMLTPAGATLSVVSFALSTAVYIALGIALARSLSTERAAVISGLATGLAAGLIGGTIRAVAASDYVGRTVSRYGLGMEFLVAVLAVFVLVSMLVSAAGGATITWLSFRGVPRRPMPRPPS